MSDYRVRISGFSLAEILIVLIIASMLAIATVPVFTKAKFANTNINSYVVSCVASGSTSNAACYSTSTESAITDCMYDKNNACESLIGSVISGGASSSTSFPVQVLNTACNLGAAKACDFLIQSCISTSGNCNSVSSSIPSLYPYLTSPATSTSLGKVYISKMVQNYCNYNQSNIVNAVLADCSSSNPITSYVACNFTGKNCTPVVVPTGPCVFSGSGSTSGSNPNWSIYGSETATCSASNITVKVADSNGSKTINFNGTSETANASSYTNAPATVNLNGNNNTVNINNNNGITAVNDNGNNETVNLTNYSTMNNISGSGNNEKITINNSSINNIAAGASSTVTVNNSTLSSSLTVNGSNAYVSDTNYSSIGTANITSTTATVKVNANATMTSLTLTGDNANISVQTYGNLGSANITSNSATIWLGAGDNTSNLTLGGTSGNITLNNASIPGTFTVNGNNAIIADGNYSTIGSANITSTSASVSVTGSSTLSNLTLSGDGATITTTGYSSIGNANITSNNSTINFGIGDSTNSLILTGTNESITLNDTSINTLYLYGGTATISLSNYSSIGNLVLYPGSSVTLTAGTDSSIFVSGTGTVTSAGATGWSTITGNITGSVNSCSHDTHSTCNISHT